MPIKDATDVTVILDRSGSMEDIASDVIGGFNRFLADQQRQPGECGLTLDQFDDRYEVVYAVQPIAEAPGLTNVTFQPRGSTALLDAIGRSVRYPLSYSHDNRPRPGLTAKHRAEDAQRLGPADRTVRLFE